MTRGAKMLENRPLAERHKFTLPLVKKLAKAPYGRAADAIRQSGFWNEEAVPEEQRETRPWRVRVSADLKAYAYVTVYATDEEDAMEKATEEVERCDPDWDVYGSDDVIAEDAEPVKPKMVREQSDLEDFT